MNKYISFFKTCFAPLFIFLLAMTMVFAGCRLRLCAVQNL